MDDAVRDRVVAKLAEAAREFAALGVELERPEVLADHRRVRDLSVRRAALGPLVARFGRYSQLQREAAEHRALIAAGEDRELVELARAELPGLERAAGAELEAIAAEWVTAEDAAVAAVILEVRAGTGGAEAALFAGEVFEMYQRFALLRGWRFEVLELSAGEVGGLRQGVAAVSGPGVWQGLGYEGGVHCVKRVPATEAQGRIHTSTATVAVLPEPTEVDVPIPESDVKIDVTTAQGPGGQNVNKVATAVKMVHVPTGIEVRMQESKSQQQNRAKAWQLLRARVFDHYQRQAHAQRAQQRSAMIGSGDRSERVRTYRFKESIAVDHRLEQSFPLRELQEGRLDGVVGALVARDRAQRLAAL